jgi:hypothetical protein
MERTEIRQNETETIITKHINRNGDYLGGISENICFSYLEYFKNEKKRLEHFNQQKTEIEDIKFNYIGKSEGERWEIIGNNFEIKLWSKSLIDEIILTIKLSKDFNKSIPIL